MKNSKRRDHDKEHQKWSRRQFLTTSSMASLGGLMLGTTPVSAFAPDKMMAALNTANSDRVLVLIYLSGGNDSLNTIIPYSVDVGLDKYREFRPILKREHGTNYTDNHLLNNYGDTNFALNSNMSPLMPMWNNGDMNVIHNVGYPNPNFSHFTSAKFWFAGVNSKTDPNYLSGWMGRYLEQLYPSFLEASPTVPPALSIGGQGAATFLSSGNQGMELPFQNPGSFEEFASSGQFYDTNISEDCNYGAELAFARRVANNSLFYADVTHTAYENGANDVSYSNNILAKQLKIVARLIKGGLGTKIYMVTLGGFDTHVNQLLGHPTHLGRLANALSEFHQDLAATGDDERVISFPFSEFGRSIRENSAHGGPAGTDHGSLADLMLFGKGVNGGFSGTPLNLYSSELAAGSSVVTFGHEDNPNPTDYRSIYATLLQDWLCVDGVVVDYALGKHYPRIPNLIADPCTTNRGEQPEVLLGHRTNVENAGMTEIRYGILDAGRVKIDLHNSIGQKLTTLVDEYREPGTYIFKMDAQTYPFSEGEYFYKMHAGGKEYMRKLEITL